MILAKTASRLVERWKQRRGVVLLAVLIVVVMLSLAAYQYGDLMLSEHKATMNAHRSAQARSLADSGVNYAAAILSSPDAIADMLNGNPWYNPDAFKDIEVKGDPNSKVKGMFSIISPVDPGDSDLPGGVRYGVLDEGGRINLNSLLKLDPSGDTAYEMLMALPNMTDEIANAIVDWIDSDTTPRTGGAESDYYQGLNPPYRCKNGPLDSIEELLLVKGITKELLFGNDLNRNGIQDADEADGTGVFDRGWSAYLTVFSRESNRDSEGTSYVFLNNPDLNDMYTKLSPVIGDDMAKYIIMYRQYGPANSSGQTQSLGSSLAKALGLSSSSSSSSSSSTKQGAISDYQLKFTRSGRNQLKSVFDLVNTQVGISSTDSKGKRTTTIYTSPLNAVEGQRELLPLLFESVTLFEETEIPARININTAPREVLAALPELTDTDLQNILAARPKTSTSDAPSAIFQTPAWLLTEANLRIDLLRKLDKFVTTRSQVFRVQVVGYFDTKGPASRVEAVIDVNAGRPRIVAWRDLSELGKGLDTTK